MKRFIWIPVILLGAIAIIVGCNKSTNKDLKVKQDYTAADLYRSLILGDGKIVSQIPELSKTMNIVGAISEEQKKKNLQSEDLIISFITNNFPGYLEEFKTEIMSHDVIRIDKALKKASDITLKAVFLTKVSKLGANETDGKKIIYAALQKNPEKFNTLISDIQNKRVQNKAEIERRVIDIFELNADNARSLSNGSSQVGADSGDCLAINIAMVVNVVAAINGALLTNLAVAVNVETLVNLHFEVSLARQEEGLSREKLVASIAQNI